MKSPTAVQGAPHLEGQRVDLSWRNPPAADFEGAPPLVGIRIARRERTFPLGPNDSDVVYDGPVVTRFTDRVPRPSTTYYYTVFAVDGAATAHADDGSNAVAYATGRYDLADRFYRQLPAVHQRYDLPLGPPELAGLDPSVASALAALPSGLRGRGQLYRFLQAAAAPLDLMRSLAEGLRDLRDVDTARPEFLVPLAEWLGWRLDRTLPVFAQRNEVKSAPRLYRTVGTIPNLRTIVTRYTGWNTQVAEFAQQIGRSNAAPPLNVFAAVEDGGRWRGVDDAGPALGFGTGNDQATGSGAVPAVLVSSIPGPFALRPGMELSVTADDRVPVVVRFQRDDFATIASATAAEVAAAINRELSEATATALQNNRLELRSNTLGPGSQLRVEQSATSLVTLEGAPRGRLSAFVDSTPASVPRLRLFYETADPLGPATTQAAIRALQGESLPTAPTPNEPILSESIESVVDTATSAAHIGTGPTRLPRLPLGRVRYKTYRGGTWGPSLPLPIPGGTTTAVGDPAAVQLTSGRIAVAWIDNPHTSSSRLQFMLGTIRAARPARLVGQRSQPFEIVPGAHLLLRGSRRLPETVEFAAADFIDPRQATADEVATVLNGRLRRVVATVQPNRTLLLSSTAIGGDERLEIDLRHSSAAAALGFDATNASASGDWGDEIDWSAPEDVTDVLPGRHADLQAIVDPFGVLWLFWATHNGSTWQVVSAHWNGSEWSRVEILSTSPSGNREPFAVLDSTGVMALFWSAREATNPRQDNWTLRRRDFSFSSLPPRDESVLRGVRLTADLAGRGEILPEPSGSWGAEVVVTTVPASGRARDREPGAVLMPDGSLRVFFQSNRNGGPDLWTLTGGVPTPALEGPADDRAPMPIRIPIGTLWLLYRSDRSVPLSRVAIRPPRPIDNRMTSPPIPVNAPQTIRPGSRVSDSGALGRFAGATTVVLTDAARNGRRRRFDDLIAVTPQGVTGRELLRDDDLYTRGTVGLYVSGIVPESPVSQPMVERLRAVLERFLPINARAVVILAPRVDIELIYQPGADLEDQFQDKHPDIENYSGLDDQVFAALPDWSVLLSTTPGHLSANPANLPTLRRRTFFPPQ